METVGLFEVLGGILGGGTIATIYQVWKERAKDKGDEMQHILDTYKDMNAKLMEAENYCREALLVSNQKIQELQEKLIEFKKIVK